MMNNYILLLILATCGISCHRASRDFTPHVAYTPSEGYLKSLPNAFPPLSDNEAQTPWGCEYQIARGFAAELDLYRTISTLKRAEILIPPSNIERIEEIQYRIIYAYYLAKRYDDVISVFERSQLKDVDASFTAYRDLLIILHDSYLNEEEEEKAQFIKHLIDDAYPESAREVSLSAALSTADLDTLTSLTGDALHHTFGSMVAENYMPNSSPTITPTSYSTPTKYRSDVGDVLTRYNRGKKSMGKAELFNAALPGMGYLYVGQKQSALTSFLLNGLFIAAATHFFQNGNYAAGIITTSFEMGWYFGGIYGAGEAAKLYNERLFETTASQTLSEKKLHPVLMLNYGF